VLGFDIEILLSDRADFGRGTRHIPILSRAEDLSKDELPILWFSPRVSEKYW
jgi:hypothetical protein